MDAEDPHCAPCADILLEGSLTPEEVGVICRGAERMLISTGCQELICDVSGRPDLSVLDVLARLALLTQRLHTRLRIRGIGEAAADLAALAALTGLELLSQPLQARRQAETRE